MKPTIPFLAVLSNLVIVLAVVNGAIYQKQCIVDEGRRICLELGPRDPRSLMQGDYMVLRYNLERDQTFRDRAQDHPTRWRAVLKISEKDVAEFDRVWDGKTKLKDDEIFLSYRKYRRGFRFGIESFFFEEGDGKAYDRGRFADLRVSPEGEAVLVDLLDEKLRPIDPALGGTGPDDLPTGQAPVEEPPAAVEEN
ncbi:MAG: GDYXXLXY domain-containing protein [Verrucomicrobiales bacterium]|nr:GDYXXLXY domain-containing protein [Verrucomicrobiales bacterium]